MLTLEDVNGFKGVVFKVNNNKPPSSARCRLLIFFEDKKPKKPNRPTAKNQPNCPSAGIVVIPASHESAAERPGARCPNGEFRRGSMPDRRLNLEQTANCCASAQVQGRELVPTRRIRSVTVDRAAAASASTWCGSTGYRACGPAAITLLWPTAPARLWR